MKTNHTHPEVIHLPDAEQSWPWDKDGLLVTKIVLGKLDSRAGQMADPQDDLPMVTPFRAMLPEDLASRFPNLTHLYVWDQIGMEELPPLPPNLKCLDVRKCEHLTCLPVLPKTLEVLVIQDCPRVAKLPLTPGAGLPVLNDLSIVRCPAIDLSWLPQVVERAHHLDELELSGCEQLEELPPLPAGLRVLKANDNPMLVDLPEIEVWPAHLRRLELRRSSITSLPAFPAALDYIDLRHVCGLYHLPVMHGRPRTLFVGGSTLALPPDVLGEDEDANRAEAILEHLGHADKVADHEVKVVLLGDGRGGKSSVARRLVESDWREDELTTHGIRLWTKDIEFTPVDESRPAMARLNIWDFAGQDLYHNTHRLFLQSRAIYLLCVTEHGPGSDPATDVTDDDDLEEDDPHDLAYWRAQVESLGSAHGRTGPPPMLVLRTKADRDTERGPSHYFADNESVMAGLDHFDFSARSGDGLAELTGWLAQTVSTVLGQRTEREMGSQPMAVKRALQSLMDQNNQAYRESEGKAPSKRVPPPHPTMSVAEFNRLAGDQGINASLLLERLHLSGFLYYDQQHLPDRVILDQRWTIDGIYTVFNRKRCWQQVTGGRGRFTAGDLADWAWHAAHYTDTEQALFLGFMLSCGVCFSLGKNGRGEEEYLAPAALPLNNHAIEVEAKHLRHDDEAEESLPPIMGISRTSVLQLLVELGKEWKKAPLLWRWGGQFQSYRRDKSPTQPTSIHLDWRPETEKSYAGTLTMRRYGPDRDFLAEVIALCRKLTGFRGVSLPEVSVIGERDEEWRELVDHHKLPKRPVEVGSATAGEGFKRYSPQAEDMPVEIGISFAGDQPGEIAPEQWASLPDTSIEKWPLALAATLKAAPFKFRVEHYRIEQHRPEHEKDTARKAYLDKLVARDFVFSFVSLAYLESPWCMYELMKVYDRMAGGHQDTGVARVGTFNEARMSQTNLTAEHPQSKMSLDAHVLRHWKKWLETFNQRVSADAEAYKKADHDIHAFEEVKKTYAYWEWADCVRSEEKLKKLLAALKGEWKCDAIDTRPEEAQLQKWATDLLASVDRTEVLLRCAEDAWIKKDVERAKQLLCRALVGKAPDSQPGERAEALKRKLGVPVWDAIRILCLHDEQSNPEPS